MTLDNTNTQTVSRSISGGDKVVVSSYGNWQAEKGNRELNPTSVEEFYTDDFLHYYTVSLYQELLESIESYISENDSRERETYADYYRAMKSGGAELIYNYLTFFEYKGSHFYTYSILDELSKVIGEYELTAVSAELIERELYSMVKRLLTMAENSTNANTKVKVYLSEYDLEVEITVEEFYNKYLIALSKGLREAIDERHRLCGNTYGFCEVADKLLLPSFLGQARHDSLRLGIKGWGDTITNQHGYRFGFHSLIHELYENRDTTLGEALTRANLINDTMRKAADKLLTMTPNTNER